MSTSHNALKVKLSVHEPGDKVAVRDIDHGY